MSITVRLIFMGLIGFVPHDGGDQGLTALFPVPEAHNQNEKCKVPSHFPVVYMLEGSCDGQCEHNPEKVQDEKLKRLGLKNPSLKLKWLPMKQDLEIAKIKQADVNFSKGPWWVRLLTGKLEELPKFASQAAHFSWVPGMGPLTGGHGTIRPDCLNAGKTCPLNARFLVAGGTAATCHLFHDPNTSKVRVFDYKIQPEKGPAIIVDQQAVADAVLVTFEVEGSQVELRAWDLPSGYGQQTHKALAILTPPANSSTLTLIVAHLPSPNDLHPSFDENDKKADHKHCPPHSDLLFNLLARQPIPRPWRELNKDDFKNMDPGSCEKEMRAVQLLINPEPGHAAAACDGGSFP